MAANTNPIYSRVPDIQLSTAAVVGGNTTVDLTNVHSPSTGNGYKIFQASSSEGGRVDRLVVQPLGTNIATVMRLWVTSAHANSTDPSAGTASNAQIRDITLPATTVSQTAAIGSVECQLDVPLPPMYAIYVTLGTTVAAGFAVSGIGGKY